MKFVHTARCKRVKVVKVESNSDYHGAPGIWYRVEENAHRGGVGGLWWEICYWHRDINKAIEIADRVSTFLLEESHTDYKNRIRRKNIKINR